MPVLAEQAIKGAGLIKDSQVLIAIFSSLRIGKLRVTSPGSTGTDPISYAVGGQGIVIPADIAFFSSGTRKFISLIGAKPAIAPAIWGNTALVGTKLAFESPFAAGRPLRKVKWPSCGTVSFLNQGENSGKVSSNAIHT